jgi:hypothetical protein
MQNVNVHGDAQTDIGTVSTSDIGPKSVWTGVLRWTRSADEPPFGGVRFPANAHMRETWTFASLSELTDLFEDQENGTWTSGSVGTCMKS